MRRNVVTFVVALGLTVLSEGHTVRSLLDSWAGVSHVVDAMQASDYDVRLEHTPFCWWAQFRPPSASTNSSEGRSPATSPSSSPPRSSC